MKFGDFELIPLLDGYFRLDGEYLVFFEHDPKIAAGYIRERAGKKYVEPVIS